MVTDRNPFHPHSNIPDQNILVTSTGMAIIRTIKTTTTIETGTT